jgi:hypothetical protein
MLTVLESRLLDWSRLIGREPGASILNRAQKWIGQ